MPEPVEGLQQRRVRRVVLAREVRAGGLQLAHELGPIGRGQRRAVAQRVLVEARPAQRQRRAVELAPGRRPRSTPARRSASRAPGRRPPPASRRTGTGAPGPTAPARGSRTMRAPRRWRPPDRTPASPLSVVANPSGPDTSSVHVRSAAAAPVFVTEAEIDGGRAGRRVDRQLRRVQAGQPPQVDLAQDPGEVPPSARARRGRQDARAGPPVDLHQQRVDDAGPHRAARSSNGA